MQDDRSAILPRLLRLANLTAFDYPRSFKSILRFLVRRLRLEDAVFLFWDPRRKLFCQRIDARGTALLQSCRLKPGQTPAAAALRSGRPDLGPATACLPVGNPRHCHGVLVLAVAADHPLPAAATAEFDAIADLLSPLARSALMAQAEERRVRQLTLLSELGRELNRAQSSRDLTRAVLGTAVRQPLVAGVVLRPVLGATLLERGHHRLRAEVRPLRPALLAIEEEISALALKEESPAIERPAERTRDLPPGFPEVAIAVPLIFQGRTMGCLTLFGAAAEGGLPLALDREGKKFFLAIGAQVAQAMERVASFEQVKSLSTENDRKLRETTVLYRVSRSLHSTLRLNELVHLILSAAVLPEGGGFERAALFLLNERSGTLRGMLGVTPETAHLVLPPVKRPTDWDHPNVSAETLEAQRQTPFCRLVRQQCLPLNPQENALAWTARLGRVIFIPRPETEPASGKALVEALQLAPFACAPLKGRDGALGVLVVDNPGSREEISPDRLRFLELFAHQAGAAMENSLLVQRLENAHQDLRETQERLIQGEKMAVLGEMAASVAHELKNPLVAIGGFAQRLAKLSGPASGQKEYSDIIVREVRRMEEMLVNILAFSKKEMLCFSECRLDRILQEALDLEAFTLARHAVELEIDHGPDLPAVWGDEQKLRQVMINLIANACQAMENGGTLTLRTYRSSLRGAEAAAVEVADSGGGIPSQVLRNIFNPFFSTKEKGTGLGLSIAHRIIEHHQGEIEVQNTARGARFTVRLPSPSGKQLSIDKGEGFG